MARMLGAFGRPWCPRCNLPAGIDCPGKGRLKKAQRALENRLWRREAAWPA
jgi:hypothetical protein